VVWRLDRLGRSLGNLIQLTNELQSRHIDLESYAVDLVLPRIKTNGSGGKTAKEITERLWDLKQVLVDWRGTATFPNVIP